MDRYTASYTRLPGDFFVHIEVRDYELASSIETQMILFEKKWAGIRKSEVVRSEADSGDLTSSLKKAKKCLSSNISTQMNKQEVTSDKIKEEMQKLDWSEVEKELPRGDK